MRLIPVLAALVIVLMTTADGHAASSQACASTPSEIELIRVGNVVNGYDGGQSWNAIYVKLKGVTNPYDNTGKGEFALHYDANMSKDHGRELLDTLRMAMTMRLRVQLWDTTSANRPCYYINAVDVYRD